MSLFSNLGGGAPAGAGGGLFAGMGVQGGGGAQGLNPQQSQEIIQATLSIDRFKQISQIPTQVKQELERINEGLEKENKKIKSLNEHFKNKPTIAKYGKMLKLCRKELDFCGAKTTELLRELSAVEETVKRELTHARTGQKHLSQFNMKGIRPAPSVQLPTPYMLDRVESFALRIEDLDAILTSLENELNVPDLRHISLSDIKDMMNALYHSLASVALDAGKTDLRLGKLKTRYLDLYRRHFPNSPDPFQDSKSAHPGPIQRTLPFYASTSGLPPTSLVPLLGQGPIAPLSQPTAQGVPSSSLFSNVTGSVGGAGGGNSSTFGFGTKPAGQQQQSGPIFGGPAAGTSNLGTSTLGTGAGIGGFGAGGSGAASGTQSAGGGLATFGGSGSGLARQQGTGAGGATTSIGGFGGGAAQAPSGFGTGGFGGGIGGFGGAAAPGPGQASGASNVGFAFGKRN